MVYCGKPSNGCLTCRNRRIKCDGDRPRCGQCVKSKRDCTGYRNECDLLFRNENLVTERRANRGKNSTSSNSSRTPSDPSSREISPSEARSLISPFDNPFTWEVPVALAHSPEQKALNFCFSNFILVPRHSEASRGYLEYLPHLYANAPADSCLSSATSALSFATLGSDASRGYFLPEARFKYGEAIKRLNVALRDPVLSRQNDTLMTVLLFGLYESVTASTSTVPQWAQHTDGAVALVKLRGQSMLADTTSLKLFLAVRNQMIINHMQRGVPLDEYFDGESWTDLPGKLTNNFGNRLTKHSVQIPGLRSRANKLLVEPKSDAVVAQMFDLIASAREIDTQLEAWSETLGEHFKYTTVARMSGPIENDDYENADIFPGNIDLYYDIWIASIWNNYRVDRMFLNATIIRLVRFITPSPDDWANSAAYVKAKTLLQKMCDDVCACVPFHMGYATSKTANHQVKTTKNGVPSGGAEPSVKALGGFFLLWPLYVAGSVVVASKEQRRWIKGRLHHIADRFGINQAKVLAMAINFSPKARPLFNHPRDPSPLLEGLPRALDEPDSPYMACKAASRDWDRQPCGDANAWLDGRVLGETISL